LWPWRYSVARSSGGPALSGSSGSPHSSGGGLDPVVLFPLHARSMDTGQARLCRPRRDGPTARFTDECPSNDGRGRRAFCGAAPLPASSPLRVPIRPAPPSIDPWVTIITVANGSPPEGPDGSGVNGLTPGPLRPLGRLSPAGHGPAEGDARLPRPLLRGMLVHQILGVPTRRQADRLNTVRPAFATSRLSVGHDH
jgi:hypothetical protein